MPFRLFLNSAAEEHNLKKFNSVLFLFFPLFLNCAADAAEEKEYTYEDFKYSVCVGRGDYSDQLKEKILAKINSGIRLDDQCFKENMFATIVRRTRSPEFISALLKAGANPDLAGADGVTARMVAVSSKELKQVEPLLTGNIDFGARLPCGDTLLLSAFDNKDQSMGQKILQQNIPADVVNAKGIDGLTLLGRIVTGQIRFDEKTVRRLAELGADFNQLAPDGLTLLQKAFFDKKRTGLSGNQDLIKLMLELGADVNFKNRYGETALHVMTHYGINDRIFDMVIDRKPDLEQTDAEGNTVLLALYVNMPGSGEDNRDRILGKLIAAGANVNAVNRDGVSVLAASLIAGAAVRGRHRAAADLIAAGASASTGFPNGHSILYYAAISKNDSDAEKAVLASGADVNARDPQTGMTPLLLAILSENRSFAEKLIDAGADVNLTDKDGRTALMAAVFHCHSTSLIRKLLRAGADRNVADAQGRKASDYLEDAFCAIDPRRAGELDTIRKTLEENSK